MKKGLGKRLQINISNRGIYFLITLGIIIALSVGVYALTAGTKPNPGHSISEMGVPTGCTAGQVVSWNGSDLICGNTATKGLAVYLCPNQPSSSQCTGRPPCGYACDCTGQFLIGGGGIAGWASYCSQYVWNSGGWCEQVTYNCLQGYLVN